MRVHSLFRVKLHARVYRRKDFQSVGIDIVRTAIFLEVLIAPAIERVGGPGYGVDCKLREIPRWILLLVRPFGHHVLAQKFTEISGCSILVVCPMKG